MSASMTGPKAPVWATAALDRVESWRSLVAGRRLGVVTASASRTVMQSCGTTPGHRCLPPGRRTDQVLRDAGADIIRLFSPEHGLDGLLAAGETGDDGATGDTAISVISLYGPRRTPEPRHMADIDAVVVDLPDVGCRAYTFAATMLAVLTAAAGAGVETIILDRPNPLGRKIGGPVVASGRTSFVAALDVPLRHGMTMGELALLAAHGPGLPPPTVIPCLWDGTPCPADAVWLPPSPGLPTSETAFVYAGMVMIEGTNLSEGRGTTLPFLTVGAPWLSPGSLDAALRDALTSAGAYGSDEGLLHWPTSFRPATSGHGATKHEGEICHGVGFHVTDRRAFDPVALVVHLLAAAARLAPGHLTTTPFMSTLEGNDSPQQMCRGDIGPDDLLRQWAADARAFRDDRRRRLLYPDNGYPDNGETA